MAGWVVGLASSARRHKEIYSPGPGKGKRSVSTGMNQPPFMIAAAGGDWECVRHRFGISAEQVEYCSALAPRVPVGRVRFGSWVVLDGEPPETTCGAS